MSYFKFFKSAEELYTNRYYDTLANSDIGDIIGFTEKVMELEKDNRLTFTREMDRDEDLADLFRFCMANYHKSGMQYSFVEFTEEVLLNLEVESKKPLSIVECCPNCGVEIQMTVLPGTEKINFCPYCGQPNIYLCSECIEEIGDCRPSTSCAYCHGHPNTNK